jgi:hypothetical protein
MEKPRLSVSSENTSQKMFVRNDKISAVMNDSDSDGGNSSELSDDMCKVNSPLSSSNSSSSEEEEVVQPEPDRGRKRKRRA